MNLVNTELIEDMSKYDAKQIYIASFNGENNILMEADNAEDARQWCDAIRVHIHYANRETERNVNRASTRISSSGDAAAAAASSSSSSSAPPVPPARPSSMASAPASAPAAAPATTTTSATTEKTSSTTAPAATTATATSASAPAESVSTDVPDLMQMGETFLDFASKMAGDNKYRTELISKIQPKVMASVTAVMDNLYEGEPGNRGEKLLGIAVLLFVMIVFGIFPRLLSLIMFFVKIVAMLMIVTGLTLSLTAVTDLGDNMSLFLIPNAKNHKIVSTGAYSIVRHPIYGGIILFTFGLSIVKNNTFQILLSILLAMILVS